MTDEEERKLHEELEQQKNEGFWTYYIKAETFHYGNSEKQEEILGNVVYKTYDKARDALIEILDIMEEKEGWNPHSERGKEFSRMVDKYAETLKVFNIMCFKTY